MHSTSLRKWNEWSEANAFTEWILIANEAIRGQREKFNCVMSWWKETNEEIKWWAPAAATSALHSSINSFISFRNSLIYFLSLVRGVPPLLHLF